MCIEILTILINNITFDYIIMSQLRQDNALTRNLNPPPYIYIYIYSKTCWGVTNIVYNVDGSKVACFLNSTPRVGWYVVQQGSKSKHYKDTCSNEIRLHHQNLITTLHSTMTSNAKTYVSN